MANILDAIVDNRRKEIEELKLQLPLASFIDSLVPSSKDMYVALSRTASKPYAGFILECKKASPSKGLIRADFDVAAEAVTSDAKLYESLDLDSIDAVDLIVRLKEETGKRVPPDDFKAVRTIDDVVKVLNAL